jgi:molybdenum cofactor cytidylyltransferase
MKGVPPSAWKIAFFNQREACQLADIDLGQMAIGMLSGYQRVVVGALHGAQGDPLPEIEVVHQPLAGIVLAAGSSSRMGVPKQLLTWGGEPLVRRAARLGIEAGFDPLVVVVGAYADEVSQALAGLDLRVVINERWAEGQSGSVKAGLAGLNRPVGGAIFLLADQPFLTLDLLGAIRRKHAQTLAPAVVPRVAGRRANPVLFDRRTFADLASLQGDSGGRQVLSQWAVEWLEWPDERIMLDIDDPEGYERAKRAID